MIADLYITLAIALLLVAALTDVAARMVPNQVCVALGLDGVAMQIAAHTLPFSVMAMLAVFIPAIVCWRHGLMGGGDVKLLGAAALLVPPVAVPFLVLSVALAGGLLGIAYWTMARLLSVTPADRSTDLIRRILRVERHRIRSGFSLPYAVAISGGTVYALSLA